MAPARCPRQFVRHPVDALRRRAYNVPQYTIEKEHPDESNGDRVADPRGGAGHDRTIRPAQAVCRLTIAINGMDYRVKPNPAEALP